MQDQEKTGEPASAMPSRAEASIPLAQPNAHVAEPFRSILNAFSLARADRSEQRRA